MKELKPSLASHYERSVLSIYGRAIGVKQRQYSKFRKREIELQKLGARVDIYAEMVCILWSGWVKDSKFTILPQNVFLGANSLEIFKLYWAMQSVKYISQMDKDRAYAIEQEYIFACNYLAYKGDGGSFNEAKYLRSYMKGKDIAEWWDSSRFPLVQHTISRLTAYGRYKTAEECYTYDDIRR